MTDDLVKRLHNFPMLEGSKLCSEAAERIVNLEMLVEQLRDDNSSLIDSFDKDFLRQGDRIEKLEAALREVLSLGDWGANILARTVILEALETKD